jgi:hypothetical protein
LFDTGYDMEFGDVTDRVFTFLCNVERVGFLGGEVVGGGGVFGEFGGVVDFFLCEESVFGGLWDFLTSEGDFAGVIVLAGFFFVVKEFELELFAEDVIVVFDGDVFEYRVVERVDRGVLIGRFPRFVVVAMIEIIRRTAVTLSEGVFESEDI